MSVDSPDSTGAEDEEDERSPEPSGRKWDFFRPFEGAKPSKVMGSDDDGSRDEEEEQEQEENEWIVEDDGPEGVPELPVAFNMSSHQDLSHHFKIICQLFVHLAVRSPSQRFSFMRDIKTGKHMNCLQCRSVPMYWMVQARTNTSMPRCQRCGER